LTAVYEAIFETFLTICNSFLPIGNNFVANDEHNHYVLIYEAIILSLQYQQLQLLRGHRLLRAHPQGHRPRAAAPVAATSTSWPSNEQIHYMLIHEDTYHKQNHRLQHQG
jgi:hypothetical protein